jgi:hypothetical protein
MSLDSLPGLPTCSICLETISSDRLITTPCGHTYHKICLVEQVNNSTYDSYRFKCAHCRTDIETFLQENIVSNMNIILYESDAVPDAIPEPVPDAIPDAIPEPHNLSADDIQNIVTEWEVDELYRLLCHWDDYQSLFGIENSEDNQIEQNQIPTFEEFVSEI